jgi:hypothetical protein
MMIARGLFVVPFANDKHGKSTIINSLLSQALGAPSPERKGARVLVSPSGRKIDAYVFVRSYQETEKRAYKSVARALKKSDPDWKQRELILFPSHVSHSEDDIDEMISVAHAAGFDTVCATVLLDTDNRSRAAAVWEKNWDERWTVPNPNRNRKANQVGQLRALGSDLWVRICKTILK